ncbi:MAG: hypothetical protein IDH49_04060 [Gammaproteobacteria bacterium]|nr:hypothetical protein [Gammaproteobacteria bacterium]
MNKHALIFSAVLLMSLSEGALALDSYRYLHVTIDTPWLIFLFLLPTVLAPLIVMAILYWYFAMRKRKKAAEEALDKVAEAERGA